MTRIQSNDSIFRLFICYRFVRLRQEDPNALSRVKVLEGNLSYNDFGMSERDKELLENVSVVFHAGGPCDETVRFSKQLSRIQAIVVVRSIFERASDDRVAEAGREEGEDDGPVALVRVPLVGPALREPMPGFVDTLKGSTALIAGAGHVLGNSNLQAEIIPIDLAVNTLITVAWERATS